MKNYFSISFAKYKGVPVNVQHICQKRFVTRFLFINTKVQTRISTGTTHHTLVTISSFASVSFLNPQEYPNCFVLFICTYDFLQKFTIQKKICIPRCSMIKFNLHWNFLRERKKFTQNKIYASLKRFFIWKMVKINRILISK